MIKRAIEALDSQFYDLTTCVNMAQFCLLHVRSGDKILLADGTDVMGDFTRVAEQNLWGCLEARLCEDIQVRSIAQKVVPDDLIIRWASQAMRHLCQVCNLLRDVSKALID